MIKWLKRFLSPEIDQLELENQKLKEELNNCGEKLIEKQIQINKTNAYWKKRYFTHKKKHND